MSENHQLPNDAPKTNREQVQPASSAWKRWLSRKWVFPAIYLCAAAIILSLMWVYQDTAKKQQSPNAHHTVTGTAEHNGSTTQHTGAGSQATGSTGSDGAVPVNAQQQTMQWPVENQQAIQVVMPFYDKNATADQKASAMIEYQKQFMPNTGISISSKDGSTLTVLASMDGTVSRVDDNPLLGQEVEVTQSNGLTAVYASLANVQVKVGDKVTQGQMIATAGRNELEASEGAHLHFELLKNGQPVNPEDYLAKAKS